MRIRGRGAPAGGRRWGRAWSPVTMASVCCEPYLAMCAIAGEPRYAVDERELAPGASGYTFDTLRSLQDDFPGTSFVLLMGADQYAKRGSWHRWADIEKLCGIAVVARPGWKLDEKAKAIPMTPLPVSASDIRARIARGDDVAAMLPAPVLAYIREQGLYR